MPILESRQNMRMPMLGFPAARWFSVRMSYGFWLLVGQGAQINLAAAQLRVQQGMFSVLAQQQAKQRQQAALSQLVFDLQQAAPRLHHLGQQDGFAAWVLANMRVRLLQGVDVQHFDRLEDKHAFAGAVDGLRQVAPWVYQGPEASYAVSVLEAIVAATQWYQVLGSDPHGEMKKRDTKYRSEKMMFQGSAITAAVCWLIAILFSGSVAVGFGLVGAVSTLVFLVYWTPFFHAKKEHDSFKSFYDRFVYFSNDQGGGVLLNEAIARHPALA